MINPKDLFGVVLTGVIAAIVAAWLGFLVFGGMAASLSNSPQATRTR